MTIDDTLDNLCSYLIELDDKYLLNHKDPLEDPNEYKFDIRSFCILSHAAFEEFIENLSISVLNEIEQNFKLNQRISFSTLCLIHFHGIAKELDGSTWNDNDRIYDYLLTLLEKIKKDFSNYIFEQNHGISLKYLKKLLIPIGIDITLEPRYSSALSQLAQWRGGYAHTSHRSIKSISPDDARICVSDIYEMMNKISKKAKRIKYYSIH